MRTRSHPAPRCDTVPWMPHVNVNAQRDALRAYIERRRLETHGWSVNAWAKRAGVREGAVRNFLKGRSRSLNYTTAMKLAAAERVPISEIFGYGDVSPLRPVRWARVHDPRDLIGREPFSVSAIATNDAVFVPVVTEKETVAAIPMEDGSMNRQIPPGSYVAFDYSDNHPEDGRIYVATVDDVPVVRRFRDRNGPLRFEADSTESWPTLYPRQGYRIIGQVVWYGAQPR